MDLVVQQYKYLYFYYFKKYNRLDLQTFWRISE